jgi:hypothetical protein
MPIGRIGETVKQLVVPAQFRNARWLRGLVRLEIELKME